jgi:hypothetical protein
MTGAMPDQNRNQDNICATIITPDFLPLAVTLARSLRRQGNQNLAVLVVDGQRCDRWTAIESFLSQYDTHVMLYGLEDLGMQGPARAIIDTHPPGSDKPRWSLKSCFLQHLLARYEKALFLDCDLHFFDAYQFLFDRLDRAQILLTPHWRRLWPVQGRQDMEFLTNFRDGLFNAGFVGVRRGAEDFLAWWAAACQYSCDQDYERGIYADQRYLDLVPVHFGEQLNIVEHRGCNVAIWNRIDNERQLVGNRVLINGRWPIVFIHVTQYLLDVHERFDTALKPYLEEYARELETSRRLLHEEGLAI